MWYCFIVTLVAPVPRLYFKFMPLGVSENIKALLRPMQTLQSLRCVYIIIIIAAHNMYVFTYNRICMAIGRKLQHCDVDSNDSSTARTRRVIIMQARAAAGRGQRSTRHRSRGCTNFWQGERGKIYVTIIGRTIAIGVTPLVYGRTQYLSISISISNLYRAKAR